MDDIDQAIVSCLLQDARATYNEIGAEVGLSAPAVKRHMLASDIQQLERAIDRVRDEPTVDHTPTTIVLSRLVDRPRS